MPYSTNWVDAPDFKMHIDNLSFSFFSTAVALVLALIWLWRPKASMVGGLIIAIIASSFSGTHTTNFLKTAFGYETPYDHVSRVLRSFLPQEELDRSILIGQYEMLQRAVFSSLTGSAEIRPPVDSLDKSDLTSAHSWLVAFDGQVITGLGEPTILGQGFVMYSLNPSNKLAPKEEMIDSFSNPCATSSLSQWACGSETEVILKGGYPANANVDLILELPLDAAVHEIEFVLGESTLARQLVPGINSINLNFLNPWGVETLLVRSVTEGRNQDSATRLARVLWGLARSQ
jgi:hypothetical protein